MLPDTTTTKHRDKLHLKLQLQMVMPSDASGKFCLSIYYSFLSLSKFSSYFT